MKVSKAAVAHLDRNKPRQVEAVLPLLDDEDSETSENLKASTFKLRTVPADADSPKYSFVVPVINDSVTVRNAIKWYKKVQKVFVGLNIGTAEAKHTLIQELCEAGVLTAYTTAVDNSITRRHKELQEAAKQQAIQDGQNAREAGEALQRRIQRAVQGVGRPDGTNADINAGTHAIMRHVCPYKALAKQKRFMRRKMRKPADMPVRVYVNRLIDINNNEIPHLPPFDRAQVLEDDELVDIITFGLPKSWINKMDEHDFDPFASDINGILSFCERMESAEESDKYSSSKPAAQEKKTSKKHKPHSHHSGKKWCEYHEVDTHNTKDCQTLKKLKAKSSGSEDKPYHKNKTWKRKSEDAKSYSKKELAAIAKKASRDAIKKATAECNAVSKRKNDSDDSDDSSVSSESEKSVNMMEAQMAEVDKQLADFDFDKIDKEVEC